MEKEVVISKLLRGEFTANGHGKNNISVIKVNSGEVMYFSPCELEMLMMSNDVNDDFKTWASMNQIFPPRLIKKLLQKKDLSEVVKENLVVYNSVRKRIGEDKRSVITSSPNPSFLNVNDSKYYCSVGIYYEVTVGESSIDGEGFILPGRVYMIKQVVNCKVKSIISGEDVIYQNGPQDSKNSPKKPLKP